jgi:hypothetical protein
MSDAEHTDRISEPAPDFLAHLERELGWSEAQAIEALGAYVMSTEAGRALRRELGSKSRARGRVVAFGNIERRQPGCAPA